MFKQLTEDTEFFSTMLGVAGVLLGLAFSALLFILAGGFKEFPFSRRMFLKFYAILGANLLASLAWIVLACFGALFLNTSSGWFQIAALGVNAFWLKTLLDYKSHRGYIQTLNSKKFCPSGYGNFRRYFRYIRNLGKTQFVVLGVELWVLLILPIVESWDAHAGEKFVHWLYVSAAVHFFYSLARIAAFIPQFFHITQTEYENADPLAATAGEEKSKSGIDYPKEHERFLTHLRNHGFAEVDPSASREFLDGSISINYLGGEKREAWLNIWIDCSLLGMQEILSESLVYGRSLLDAFCNCGCDLQEIVISYHFNTEGLPPNDTLFFRTDRGELEADRFRHGGYRALFGLKNKVVDPIWKGHLEE